jgi:hypothetical protein
MSVVSTAGGGLRLEGEVPEDQRTSTSSEIEDLDDE